MTAINQHSVANHYAVEDQPHQTGNRSGGDNERRSSSKKDTSSDHLSNTIQISYLATQRLKEFEAQRMLKQQVDLDNGQFKPIANQNQSTSIADTEKINTDNALSVANDSQKLMPPGLTKSAQGQFDFPPVIKGMLNEVEESLVNTNEPGYKHLVNVLNNHHSMIEDQQQLQEIMRKEQFYLNRRKAFMSNSEFQSYSQVLGQFSNIVERF